MHELLKEMATELVRQKSANKLWDSKFWILRDFCVYLPKYSAVRIAKDIMKKWSKPHEIPFSTIELAEFWSKITMHESLMSQRVEGFKIFRNLTSINFEVVPKVVRLSNGFQGVSTVWILYSNSSKFQMGEQNWLFVFLSILLLVALSS
ncbi:uncharacterized protein LOC133740644 isoform X2 [Rosa rugosa]|uniref:uncharacterized protein LOC133740644 isoform X2 n=1 Tax=Rosa rugosa TaxID=74645 RepID=UPI002B40CD01|nr:uncharacterized protein LOC133740644 isoform X2 [Rosa rugosa]